ncbi:phage repressor protein C with HTH and peptisase S24 domain [Sphingomonas sp. PvP055]|uniref:S24 family peptidase n=1 Tax=Sphingomonas sp. PvP055 TaxID=3156391 RepID=UPI00339A1F8E
MTSATNLEGPRLYDALIALKPPELAETEWAAAAGVNRGFFGNLKTKSKNPRRDTIGKLLAHIGKSEADLAQNPPVAPKAGGRVSQLVTCDAGTIDDSTVDIISLDLTLSMGPGTVIEEFVEDEPVKMDLGFVQAITRTPSDRLRLVKGVGDSMEPTLRSHDRIMVDINDRQLTRINGIYWIDYCGSHGIKRLRPAGQGRVMIISDNPAVENYEVGADELRIEGRVIWFAREL